MNELFSLFLERKNTFISSLQRAVTVVSADRFIKQMFEDDLSAMYIPDRVIELVKQILYEDRENFIEKLIHRLNSLEACIGSDLINEFEGVGMKILDLSNNQMNKEEEQRECIKLLKERIKQIENRFDEIQTQQTNSSIRQMKKINESIKSSFIDQSKSFLDIIRKTRKKSFHQTENLQKTIELLTKENQKMKKENLASKKVINETLSERDEILKETEGKDAIKYIQQLKNENNRLNEKNDTLSKQLKKIKEMNDNLVKASETLSSQNETLKNQKNELENEKMKMQKIINENQNLSNRNKVNGEKSISEYKERITRIKNTAENAIIEAKKEIDNLNKTKAENTQIIKKLTNQISELNNEVLNEKNKNQEQSLIISNLEKQNQNEFNQTEKLKEKIKILEENSKVLESTKNSLMMTSEEVSTYKDRIKELQNQLFHTNDKIETLINENSELKSLEIEYKISQNANIKLQNQLDDLTMKIEELSQKSNEYNLTISEKNKTIENLTKANLQLKSENEKLLRQKATNEATIEAMKITKNAVIDNSNQIETLLAQNNELSSALKTKDLEVTKIKEANKELYEKLHSKSKNSDGIFSISSLETMNYADQTQQLNKSDLKRLQKELKKLTKEKEKAVQNLISFREQIFSELSVNNEIDFLVKIKTMKENDILLKSICNLLEINDNSLITIVLKREIESKNDIKRILSIGKDDDIPSVLRSMNINFDNHGNRQLTAKEDSIITRIAPMIKVDNIDQIPSKIHKLILKEADNSILIQQICKLMNTIDQSQLVSEIHSLILREKENNEFIHKAISIIETNPRSILQNTFSIIQKIKDMKLNNDKIDLMKIDLNCNDIDEVQKKIIVLLNDQKDFNHIKEIFSIYDDNSELIDTVSEMKNYLKQSCNILSLKDETKLVNSIQKMKIDFIDTQAKITEKDENLNRLNEKMIELEEKLVHVSKKITNKEKEKNDEQISLLKESLSESNRKASNLQLQLKEKQALIEELNQSMHTYLNEISKLKLENTKANSIISELHNRIKEVSTEIIELQNKLKTNTEMIELQNKLKTNAEIIELQNKLKTNTEILDLQSKTNNTTLEATSKDVQEKKLSKNENNILKSIGSLLNATDPNGYTNEIESLKSQVEFLNEQLNAISMTISVNPTDPLQMKIDEIVNDLNLSNTIFDKLFRILNIPSKSDIVPTVSEMQKQLVSYRQKERMLMAATNVNSDVSLLSTVRELKQIVDSTKNQFDLPSVNDIVDLSDIFSLISVKSLKEAKDKIKDLLMKEKICTEIYTIFDANNKELTDLPSIAAKFVEFHDKSKIKKLCIQMKVDNNDQFLQKVEIFNDTILKITQILGTDLNSIVENITNLLKCNDNITTILGIQNSQQIESELQNRIQELTKLRAEHNQILNDLKVDDQYLIKRLHELIKSHKTFTKILKKLNIKENEIIPAVLGYQEISENISEILENNGSNSLEHLSEKFYKIKKSEKKTCSLLNITKKSEINPTIKHMKSTIDNAKELLHSDDIISSIQQQLNFVSEIKSIISSNSAWAGKDLSLNLIEEIKSLYNTINNTRQILKSFSPDNDINDLNILIKNVKLTSEKYNKIQSLINAEDVYSTIQEMNECINAIKSIYKTTNLSELIEQIRASFELIQNIKNVVKSDDILTDIKKNYKCIEKIKGVLQTNDILPFIKENYETTKIINNIINENEIIKEIMSDIEKEHNYSIGFSIDKNSFDLIKTITMMFSIMNSIYQIFNTGNFLPIIKSNKDMINEIKEILASDNIIETIKSENNTVITIKALFKSSEDIIQNVKNNINLLTQITSLFGEDEDIITKIKSNIDLINSLQNISGTSIENIIDNYQNLIKENQKYKSFCSELQTKMFTFKNDHNNSDEKVTINSLKNKLRLIVEEYKQRTEDAHRVIEKAASLGYKGSSVYDATEYIVSNELKLEKQRNLMESHKSLTELRQTTDKERSINESQNQKANVVIQQLRKNIAEIRESENQVQQELIDEKQKRKALETELVHLKELNKSLSTMINDV
ncbi:hypothetical protein TRFO_31449 [Tritrichomonas foetus]|uniref:Uncharacterized protein n=1 Tax=Tritrichomonas foetus TaxID=1144522 RepID=A0A1J4JSC3_9EUKA|nr:hypothetical protein TRFO_31449 [Tritrichomonas foetus]|eukprot:OHT01666.1 hypothetical protein TRFO_31449 [Tritrichomonas foetus]